MSQSQSDSHVQETWGKLHSLKDLSALGPDVKTSAHVDEHNDTHCVHWEIWEIIKQISSWHTGFARERPVGLCVFWEGLVNHNPGNLRNPSFVTKQKPLSSIPMITDVRYHSLEPLTHFYGFR